MSKSISKLAQKDLELLNQIEKECYKYFRDNNYSASYYQLFIHVRKSLKNKFKNYFDENQKFQSYMKEYSRYFNEFDLFSNVLLNIVFNKLTENTYVVDTFENLKNELNSDISIFIEEAREYHQQIHKLLKLRYAIHLSENFNENTIDYDYNEQDIYILSLQFFQKNWKTGISFIEYQNFIFNELNFNINVNTLSLLYKQITNIDALMTTDEYHVKNIGSLQSMLGLLEYIELNESLEQAKDAKMQAEESKTLATYSLWIAIGSSVLSIIISIIFGVNQWKLNDKIDLKPLQEIKSRPYQEQPMIKPLRKY